MAIGPRGIDIRQGSGQIVFRAFLTDPDLAVLTTGTVTLALVEMQSNGSFETYDFLDNTFKTTACTTPTVSMTHQMMNNGGTNTGLWTYALATLTDFTAGGVYFSIVSCATASEPQQVREFQFSGVEGTQSTFDPTATGVNVTQIGGDTQSATDLKDFADAGYDPATNKVQGVVLVDTTTTNTDMRGTDSAYTGTPPTAAAIADQVWDEAFADHVGAGTFGKLTADILAKWTTAMVESYAAAGATKTPEQCLYEIVQHLQNHAISSTTQTVKKLDGTTTAMTLTLNSATDPTALARAT